MYMYLRHVPGVMSDLEALVSVQIFGTGVQLQVRIVVTSIVNIIVIFSL